MSETSRAVTPSRPSRPAPERRDRDRDPALHVHDVLVLGTGFSGIGVAIRLVGEGNRDFVMLERATALGGTWRDNTYPGCACDVPSHLYSFSFEPKADWTRAYSPQEEIRAYLEGCVARHDLGRHMRFGRNVVEARFDEDRAVWTVTTDTGERFAGRVLVSGIGALSNPSYANVPGLEKFQGKTFHSATWDHEYALKGKRVGVIGTGASAIQFVPKIQPEVGSLTLFQRTAPWILPKPDRAYSALEKAAFSRVPGRRFLHRQAIYWRNELFGSMFSKAPRTMALAAAIGKWHIRRSIRSPALRALVTPTFLPGCKRILLSNDYYPALDQPNVEVVGDPIREADATGLVLASGRKIELDAIIHGTGFTVQSYLGKLRVYGRDGKELGETWGKNAAAYRGTTVPGYPNLFTLLGPNTGLGHTSVVLMIEAQIRYVMDALGHMKRTRAASVEVLPHVMKAYDEAIGKKLDRSVWASGCESWYLNDEGRNTTLYPGLTFEFMLETRRFRAEDHRQVSLAALESAPSVENARPSRVEGEQPLRQNGG